MSRGGKCGLPPPQPYPWLLYRHGKGYANKTFRSIGPESAKQQYSRPCKLPQLRGKLIIASFKGWLLLQKACSNNYQHYVLWNPSTFESIDLAPLKLGKNHEIDYHLLYEEDGGGEDGSRKMLNLLLSENTMPCIFRCRIPHGDGGGGGNWVAIHYRKVIEAYFKESGVEHPLGPSYHYPLHLENPLFCDGKLYALTHYETRLVELEIKTDSDDDTDKNAINRGVLSIRWLGCELPSGRLNSNFLWRFWLESKGEIFCIVFELHVLFESGELTPNKPVAIYVFKLNFSDMTWIELDSLEDRVFFLCFGFDLRSYKGLFSFDVVDRDRGNLIYFTKRYEKYLYSYNMEDKSISVTLPCPHLTEPWLSPVWVMPEILNHGGGKPLAFQHKEEDNEETVLESLFLDAEKQEERLTTHAFDLGFDLLAFISKKLLCFDYMFFRESCRMFRDAAPLIRWRTVSSEVATRNSFSRTCLVIPGNRTDCNQDLWCVVDPHVLGRKYLMTSPNLELPEQFTIKCSKDGWLLLSCSEVPTTFLFFNPFTKAMIPLPHLDRPGIHAGFTFSSLPTSDDCVTICIEFQISDNVQINLFFRGKDNWETVEFGSSYLDFLASFNSPVFLDGAVYFLGQRGNLGVLTIHEEGNHGWQLLDKPKSPCKSFHEHFLVECRGELLSVFVGYMGKRVEVFKLSSSKLVWEKVETLGNYVLFVSRGSSFSTLAKSRGMENRIYFPRFYEGNPVYYSLDTGKFHVVGSNDSLLDFCGTAEQLTCGWIEPRWC